MRKSLFVISMLSLALLAGSALAQEPDAGPVWQSLFNGRDLTGWVKVGQEKWEVVDGIIHGQGVTDQYGYLRTEKQYSDFQLALRFKCLADGNSGVYFHSDFRPGTVDISQGRQFEIDRKIGNHTGGIYGDGRGWEAWPAPEFEPLIRPAEWNEFLLIVDGNRYITYLNGVRILDYTNPSPQVSDGYISLQLHSGGEGNMMFKDIYIRDLRR